MLQFFVFRLRNAVTSNLLSNYYTVEGLYFFGSSSRNKENTEQFKKYLMNVSHKISEFRPPFSETKEKQKLRSLKICV